MMMSMVIIVAVDYSKRLYSFSTLDRAVNPPNLRSAQ